MARILVTEPIAEGGLDRLRAAGHTVDVQEGLSPEQLLETIPGARFDSEKGIKGGKFEVQVRFFSGWRPVGR